MSDPEFAAMMKRLGVQAPKGGWGKKSTTNKSSDSEFAAMMKRLGIQAPKGNGGKKSTTNKSRKRTLSPADKRRQAKLKALGPSRKVQEKNKLLHSSTEDLKKERIARKNAPFRPRTDVYGDIKIPREIKERMLGQEAVGARGGGMIGKNKVIQGYKKGGQV